MDLGAKPGTEVADALLNINAVDSPSSANADGTLVAMDPATYGSDPVAQACAPGLHTAVWATTIAIVGQPVSLVLFIDQVAGGGYTIRSCPTGLPASSTKFATGLIIGAPDLISAPRSPGTYVWRALVTPQSAPQYELQAVAPLPESATLHARSDTKTKTAVLTGRVLEAGKPVPNLDVRIAASHGDDLGTTLSARTRADGTFSARTKLKVTTDFQLVAVGGDPGPCQTASTAPGGCAGSTTVPPAGGSATVWVSVRGGAQRAIRVADQRLADRENLAGADFPPELLAEPSQSDSCLNRTGESTLTITGESSSGTFVSYGGDDEDSARIVQATAVARVYATVAQAKAAFAHEATLATPRCDLEDAGPKAPKVKPVSPGKLAARSRAFRAIVALDMGETASVDWVFLQRGRSVVTLFVLQEGATGQIEHGVLARVAGRMR